MLNIETFKDGMGALLEAFPDRKFNNRVIYRFLQDLTEEEFLSGVQKVISSNRELYPGSNIIAHIREGALAKKHISAGEAWALVISQIHSVGSWGRPSFSDPLVAKAVECVGWREMCISENPSIERAHFLKIYDSLERREKEEAVYLPENIVHKLLK